jgi:hypothetical protein
MADDGGPSSGPQSTLALSGDGVWAAYAESGGRPPGSRIFLRQFPDGPRYAISQELAAAPVWSREPGELFYFQSESRTLVSIRIQLAPGFPASDPVPIPIRSIFQPESGYRQFDVMPDGRLLILQPAAEDGRASRRIQQQVNVVLNWLDQLPRIAPRR